MIRYSVIIPQRDRGDDLRRQLPALTATLAELGEPYEILIVDDGSGAGTLRLLDKMLTDCHAMRVVRLDRTAGASVAIGVGVKAARGEVLIAIEPGDYYPADQITSLVHGLCRADLVAGRRHCSGVAKLWQRIVRIPRWLLLGLDGHDPECLLWAARREVFDDLSLTAGMVRYLPAFVARRGFRVCETYVQCRTGAAPRRHDVPANLGDLLAAWWSCRRWCDATSYELSTGAIVQPTLRVVGADNSTSARPTTDGQVAVPAFTSQQAKRA